jgi:Ca2+-binding EF-hand superfamily protein
MKAKQFLLAGAVAALLPFAAAVAQSPPSSQPSSSSAQNPATDPAATQSAQPAQRGTTFESLDTDGDGRISKTEAAANQTVLDQFSRYDKDGNGFIEKAEVTSTNKSSSPGETPQQ